MRRTALALAVALVAAPMAEATFGIFKTRITLPRNRPPQIPILSPQVFVDVVTGPTVLPVTSDVYSDDVETVRKRVREAIASTRLYRLVDTPRDGACTVTVVLSPPTAGVRDVVRTENQTVVVGQAEGWDDEKKHTFLYDVYGERPVEVTRRYAVGRVEARVTVAHGSRARSSVVSASYSFEPAENPLQTATLEALRNALVKDVATRAAAVVGYASEPVQVLLAVNGELRKGNTLAEAGRFEEALGRWSARTLKGGAEAARRHNMGVAHEALAYRLPLESEDHRHELEVARDLYRQAVGLDPDEKYFKEPLARIEVSLRYAEAVRVLAKHIDDSDAPPDGGATMVWIGSLAPTPR